MSRRSRNLLKTRRKSKSRNAELFESLLATFPGARKAAHGVILPGPKGSGFHVFGFRDEKEGGGLTENEKFFLDFCSKQEVIRLRELHNAHDYLLRLRAMAIVDAPRAIRVFIARRQKTNNWSLTGY